METVYFWETYGKIYGRKIVSAAVVYIASFSLGLVILLGFDFCGTNWFGYRLC